MTRTYRRFCFWTSPNEKLINLPVASIETIATFEGSTTGNGWGNPNGRHARSGCPSSAVDRRGSPPRLSSRFSVEWLLGLGTNMDVGVPFGLPLKPTKKGAIKKQHPCLTSLQDGSATPSHPQGVYTGKRNHCWQWKSSSLFSAKCFHSAPWLKKPVPNQSTPVVALPHAIPRWRGTCGRVSGRSSLSWTDPLCHVSGREGTTVLPWWFVIVLRFGTTLLEKDS